MPIDLKTVIHTAELARLDLSYGLDPEEAQAALDKLAEELAGIVGHIDILSELKTNGIEPLYSPMLEPLGPREDIAVESGAIDDIMSQAPDRIGNLFAVPKII